MRNTNVSFVVVNLKYFDRSYSILRKPVDATFVQHTAEDNTFRFSVSPFNMAGVPQAYIHCKSIVTCKCNDQPTAVRDDVYNDENDSDTSYYAVDSTARVEIAESVKVRYSNNGDKCTICVEDELI